MGGGTKKVTIVQNNSIRQCQCQNKNYNKISKHRLGKMLISLNFKVRLINGRKDKNYSQKHCTKFILFKANKYSYLKFALFFPLSFAVLQSL